MSPIALTDSQLDAVMAAAAPLAPGDRSAFLQDLAVALRDHPEIGDGLLHRVVADVQRRHWDAPIEAARHQPRAGGGRGR
jgi:hypothetical protein